jgi:hypothetical protein
VTGQSWPEGRANSGMAESAAARNTTGFWKVRSDSGRQVPPYSRLTPTQHLLYSAPRGESYFPGGPVSRFTWIVLIMAVVTVVAYFESIPFVSDPGR